MHKNYYLQLHCAPITVSELGQAASCLADLVPAEFKPSELAAALQALSKGASPGIADLVPVEVKLLEIAAVLKALSKGARPGIADLVLHEDKHLELAAVLQALSKGASPGIADLVHVEVKLHDVDAFAKELEQSKEISIRPSHLVEVPFLLATERVTEVPLVVLLDQRFVPGATSEMLRLDFSCKLLRQDRRSHGSLASVSDGMHAVWLTVAQLAEVKHAIATGQQVGEGAFPCGPAALLIGPALAFEELCEHPHLSLLMGVP